MSSIPRPGARIIHESEFVTEYDDGTEEVRFSPAEWEIMSKDPRFGYILRCGHPATASLSDGSCSRCEAEMGAEEPDSASDLNFTPATRQAEPPVVSLDQDEIPF